MLPLRFREPEAEHPTQEVAPWLTFLRPNVILCKDGSLLAGFEYEGLDPESVSAEEADKATEMLENAYNQFDDRVTAWWIVDKRRDPTYSFTESENPASVAVDREYSKQFTSGKTFKIRYQLYILYTPPKGSDKFFDRVGALQASGKAIGAAIMHALKESLSTRAALTRDMQSMDEHVISLTRILQGFRSAAPLRLIPLQGDGFTDALSALLNRARSPMHRAKPMRAMIDSWLPTDEIETGEDVMRFKCNRQTTYVAALGLKTWPEETTPRFFESLLKAPIELTICQIVRFLGRVRSRAEINKAIEYYRLTQYPMIAHMIAKAKHEETAPSAGKAALLAQCEAAKEEIESTNTNYVYHSCTVFVSAGSLKQLEEDVLTASEQLALLAFTSVRESKNLAPSFFSMLPAQWSQQTRYEALSVANVADCSPLWTMLPGPEHHPFFSKDLYQRPVPALGVFTNCYGGRTNFASHVGQVGHMLIVMPTGGGKTTFVNLAASFFQRYPNCNTFIFDRNKSCMITTELHGGTHIDIKAKRAKFNPFFAMMSDQPDGKHWVREFILRRLEEGNFVATAEDRRAIDEALNDLEAGYAVNKRPLRLSRFVLALGSARLKQELAEWKEGAPYGMFDTEVDDFSLNSWTTIEMREIMQVERLNRAFLDYAFRKIYESLDGRPTLIYLEEASFLLADGKFASMIDDWLKTFRKKNAFIWLTLQSPESITDSTMAATLLDNVPSMLFGVNQKIESHRGVYTKMFGLENHQVDMIANLKPQRDYLLIQGRNSRVLQTHLNPQCLAYLRSEPKVLELYEKFRASGEPDWQQQYLAAVAMQ
ncbi:VirB4 family type IV secretion system protein [Noviherbaspirillum pedocola]|uniref:CagE TrbE VirB component of type IV transporter system central domain-containing protein n=1 Tax=Noviherbaspirillum pedocola TaxID=2801341 RepID=A0A934W8P7_9BURK|nr:hypothetical protein [Noviherbaspirillum pedocola]MBK4736074.1 hypothetical protein [Noviherbaspirillum pedocola]